MCDIDNSHVSQDIKKVNVELIQHVTLYRKKKHFDLFTDERTYTHSVAILTKSYPGVEQGNIIQGMSKFMELNLSEYEHKVDNSWFGDDYSNDDQYLGNQIQPNVDGRLVKISYSLRVAPDYSTCCVCSPPETSIPLFISPPQLPSYVPLQAPANWNPQVFDPQTLTAPTVPTAPASQSQF